MAITAEEERKLIAIYHRGHGKTPAAKRAAARLLHVHAGFIAGKARVFKSMDFDDAYQIARLGFLEALIRYKLTHDAKVRLLSFATHWITVMLRNAQLEDATVRIGTTELNRRLWFGLEGIQIHLTNKLKRPPTRDEIAKYINVPVNRVDEFFTRILSAASLDAPITMDGDTTDLTLGDSIANPAPSVSETFDVYELRRNVRRVLDGFEMNDQERAIFNKRLMLSKEEGGWTLGEIGDAFGVSRERIRQIEVKLMARLRKWVAAPERYTLLTG